jgi:SAM-dependent methyltransferase
MTDLDHEIEQRRLDAPSARRTREPILEVLRSRLPATGTVLEIGSGTGQHVAWFAARLPGLVWQPSDPDQETHESIQAWAGGVDTGTVLPPLALDVTRPDWGADLGIDDLVAILSSNMIHIAPWAACEGLIEGAGRLLPAGAILHLYGPFKQGGRHTAESNERFDAMLLSRDPAWGVRDLDDITRLGDAAGLELDDVIDMPSNNFSVIYRHR